MNTSWERVGYLEKKNIIYLIDIMQLSKHAFKRKYTQPIFKTLKECERQLKSYSYWTTN